MNAAVFPDWLHTVAVISLMLAALCAVVIAIDETGRRQHMWIMYIVWPLTALFGSVLWLVFYWTCGRGVPRNQAGDGHRHTKTAMPVAVAKGASHCGAGCTLGDIIAEWLAFFVPAIAVALGWKSLFAEKMFAVWVLDYLVAFGLGVAFQYFTIKPMRDLSVGGGIVAALKADVASITAWQVGMYGFMAIAQFAWFGPSYGGHAEVNTPEFWFAMQIAMICGFCTAFPVNWLLVHVGLKERM